MGADDRFAGWTTKDPDAAKSVHGLWPLVRDAGVPGGIRPADMRCDGPDDCVTSVDDLPRCGIELRLFPDVATRDGWYAAVVEFGGNAVHASLLPHDDLPASLLLRFDRDPPAGDTVASRVTVSGRAASRVNPVWLRDGVLREVVSGLRLAEWKGRWSDVLSAVEGCGGAGFVVDPREQHGTDRLVVQVRTSGPFRALRVTGPPGGRVLSVIAGGGRGFVDPEGDLGARIRAEVAAHGLRLDGHGDLSREVGVVDAATLGRAMEAFVAVARVRSDLRKVDSARDGLRRLLVHPPTGRLLRGLSGGFPVAVTSAVHPPYQVVPSSGNPVDADPYSLATLVAAGVVEPAWWSDRVARPPRDKPTGAYGLSVWIAGDVGRRLVAGEDPGALVDDAAAVARRVKAFVDEDRASPPFGGFGRGWPAWTPPDGAPRPVFPGPAKAPRLPRRCRDLALVAAWVAHGLVSPP